MLSREAANTNIYSLWFDPSRYQIRVYCFSSRRSVHLTTDRLIIFTESLILIADFDDKAYCGKWNINLYDTNSNEWINVTIDDQLPTVNNSLLFGSCCVKNQLWFPLLEKACAK